MCALHHPRLQQAGPDISCYTASGHHAIRARHEFPHRTPPPSYLHQMSAPASAQIPPPPYSQISIYSQPVEMVSASNQHQAYTPPAPAGRLRTKVSGWISRTDLTTQPIASGYGQDEVWASHANQMGRPYPEDITGGALVQSMSQSAALCDRVAARLTDVFSRGTEAQDEEELRDLTRGLSLEEHRVSEQSRGGIINFEKTWLYANSRLPPHMLPMKFYLDTWRLLCVSAQASLDAYRRPRGDERSDHIEADWRTGTKAMVIKSRPIDDKNMIVLAIRGSRKNFVDWSVNFGTAPTMPRGFLDDEGNACHAGFLQVARRSVKPVAARLVSLLSERSAKDSYPSLLITGHSAGGAVASLLYMHMMATSSGAESELNLLTPYFKRICCVTFGVPPLSFLPLQKPTGKQFVKNEFFSFANEGDVIVRADRQYLKTVAGIIAAPAPVKVSNESTSSRARASRRALDNSKSTAPIRPPRWNVTPATLSNAGRLVLLRTKPGQPRLTEAVQITDQDLRNVVFGDPDMHSMELYKDRILELATAAITGLNNG